MVVTDYEMGSVIQSHDFRPRKERQVVRWTRPWPVRPPIDPEQTRRLVSDLMNDLGGGWNFTLLCEKVGVSRSLISGWLHSKCTPDPILWAKVRAITTMVERPDPPRVSRRSSSRYLTGNFNMEKRTVKVRPVPAASVEEPRPLAEPSVENVPPMEKSSEVVSRAIADNLFMDTLSRRKTEYQQAIAAIDLLLEQERRLRGF